MCVKNWGTADLWWQGPDVEWILDVAQAGCAVLQKMAWDWEQLAPVPLGLEILCALWDSKRKKKKVIGLGMYGLNVKLLFSSSVE